MISLSMHQHLSSDSLILNDNIHSQILICLCIILHEQYIDKIDAADTNGDAVSQQFRAYTTASWKG